jgi:hypothetical protein
VRTQVSKTHPAIKKILRNTHYGAWQGRNVTVVQVGPDWMYRALTPSGPPSTVYLLHAEATFATFPIQRESSIWTPVDGEVVVEQQRLGRDAPGPVTIYVPMLDAATLDVARDALLAGDKKQSVQVLAALGPYAGIGGAIVEAQSKTLESVSRGEGIPPGGALPPNADSETRRMWTARKRKLDREIDDFLRSRKS